MLLDLRSLESAKSWTHASDTGVYALTGSTAVLAFNRKLAASSGAYVLSGSAAALAFNRKLAASTGIYGLVGRAAALVYGHPHASATGTYALMGKTTTLVYGHPHTSATGVYALSGNASALAAGRKLAASAGTYVLAGKTATLVYGHPHTSATGVYALSGAVATFSVLRVKPMTLSVKFRDAVTAVLGDPTRVLLRVMDPAGVETDYTPALGSVSHPSVGVYQASIYPRVPGYWGYRWEGNGVIVAAFEGRFEVQSSLFRAQVGV